MGRFGKYIRNVLVGIDQTFNAVVGGDPDETLSSRCGKRAGTCGFCRFLCGLLNAIDPRHCATSIEIDEGSDAL